MADRNGRHVGTVDARNRLTERFDYKMLLTPTEPLATLRTRAIERPALPDGRGQSAPPTGCEEVVIS